MINSTTYPPPSDAKGRHAHAVILAIVTLDAIGISLVMPIVPSLLREVGHTGDLGWRFGAFLSLYALMQFLCAPVLGALSDRFGRRPVLLISVAGSAIDALFMAFAPSLWMLFLGRAIAGMTGASTAVASAAIADLTPENQRARWFGRMGACFGLGFIAGPAIGGVLGDYGVRLPFVAAAVLNGLTFLVGLLVLRESRPPATAACCIRSRRCAGPPAFRRCCPCSACSCCWCWWAKSPARPG